MTGNSTTIGFVVEIYHVGDGDSALLEFPDGTLAVIDSNRPSWRTKPPVVSALEARVAEARKGHDSCKLAFVCASHPHYDHINGLKDVVEVDGITIGEFWHPLPDIEEIALKHPPGHRHNYPGWADLAEFYYDEQIGAFLDLANTVANTIGWDNVRQIHGMGTLPDIGGVQIYALNPGHSARQKYKQALDQHLGRFEQLDRSLLDSISIALLFVYGDNTFLYASDMQSAEWVDVLMDMGQRKSLIPLLPVEAMKASHHGGPRCYYDGMWGHLVSADGTVIVSGGSVVHPHEKFVNSVLEAERTLRCTGMAICCGRNDTREEQTASWSGRWLQAYSVGGDEHSEECRGDIRVVLPSSGPVSVDTTHSARSECPSVGERVVE